MSQLYRFVKSNERRPDTEGFYYCKDTIGGKTMVHFYNNHWHSLTGHPVEFWLEPIQSNVPVGKEGEAISLLKELCELKKYKDEVGKDSIYLKHQPELWKRANEFLNSLVYKQSK